jgi:hypothetical protein
MMKPATGEDAAPVVGVPDDVLEIGPSSAAVAA